MIQILNIRNCPAGWQSDPSYVYIGRKNSRWSVQTSRWANRAIVTNESERVIAIGHYRRDLWVYLESEVIVPSDLFELEDKNLVCWCAPKRCHASELIRAIHMLRSAEFLGIGIPLLRLMLHAVGGSSADDLGWRNHYYSGPEDWSWNVCNHLVEVGWMAKDPALGGHTDLHIFRVSEAGLKMMGVTLR